MNILKDVIASSPKVSKITVLTIDQPTLEPVELSFNSKKGDLLRYKENGGKKVNVNQLTIDFSADALADSAATVRITLKNKGEIFPPNPLSLHMNGEQAGTEIGGHIICEPRSVNGPQNVIDLTFNPLPGDTILSEGDYIVNVFLVVAEAGNSKKYIIDPTIKVTRG